MFQHKATFGSESSLFLTCILQKYLSIFCLRRAKAMNFTQLLSKDISATFLKNASIAVPPRIYSRPPARTSSEVALREEKMPACLIMVLLLHIHVWIQGEDSLKHKKQSNSKEPPFLGVETCLVLAGLHCHEKKTGIRVSSLLWFGGFGPLQIVPCVKKKCST